MKLSTHCCANEEGKLGGLYLLTLQTVGDFCALCTSAYANHVLSFYVAYHFVAELLFPVVSTLL
ncbi:unnamed protein product [Staurois parvus]|uniref:Uncharacterized protein n=1 Tax=Staurois parvus TaxID=386267 RepID=A0ABN9GLW3_9NEOB|nr:unnamed protein product [Staurois parvus]